MTETNKNDFQHKASKELTLLSENQKRAMSSQYKKKMSIIFISTASSLFLFAIIMLLVMIYNINNPEVMTSIDEKTGEITANSPYSLITPCVLFALASIVLIIIYITKIINNNNNIALKIILKKLIKTDTPFENFHTSKALKLVSTVSGKQTIFLDYKQHLAVFKTRHAYLSPIPFSDIINYKVYENGSSIIESKVGRALLGSALAGTLGAVIANAGSRRVESICNDLSIIIFTTNSPKQITLHFIINGKCNKASSAYRNMQNCIHSLCGELENIIAQNHRPIQIVPTQPTAPAKISETYNQTSTQPNPTSTSQISKNDLKKLKELYEEQLISKEEYETKKRQILGI